MNCSIAYSVRVLSVAAMLALTPVAAMADCPVNASRALEEAQKIFRTKDHAQFDAALACLILALAQTRAELDGLRDGSIAFTGQIQIPKGYVMTKPSVQEGR